MVGRTRPSSAAGPWLANHRRQGVEPASEERSRGTRADQGSAPPSSAGERQPYSGSAEIPAPARAASTSAGRSRVASYSTVRASRESATLIFWIPYLA